MLFEELLFQNLQKRVHIRTPQRGDNVRLVDLAQKNAREEAERVTSKAERAMGTLGLLQNMLGLGSLHRLESYDISNIAGTDIVASMVVFVDGRPSKQDYKRFKIEGLTDQNDYASMQQVLRRRLTHYVNGDAGFDARPDALLIDGGVEHANAVMQVQSELGLDIPTFGMVKDNRHRTRALVTPQGHEISISGTPAVFALIGTIQEETHRFAITYHHTLRSRRVRGSKLEEIPGVGPKRRETLLKTFKSVRAIEEASLTALEGAIGKAAGQAVYDYFHQTQEEEP